MNGEERLLADIFSLDSPLEWPSYMTWEEKAAFSLCPDREPMMRHSLGEISIRELPSRCLHCPANLGCLIMMKNTREPARLREDRKTLEELRGKRYVARGRKPCDGGERHGKNRMKAPGGASQGTCPRDSQTS